LFFCAVFYYFLFEDVGTFEVVFVEDSIGQCRHNRVFGLFFPFLLGKCVDLEFQPMVYCPSVPKTNSASTGLFEVFLSRLFGKILLASKYPYSKFQSALSVKSQVMLY